MRRDQIMVRHTIVKDLALLGALLLTACGESEPIMVGRGMPTEDGTAGDPTVADPGLDPATDPASILDEPDAGVVGLTYRDEDFVEAETNRDPFRSYIQIFVARAPRGDAVQREVTMPRTAIDEMRLIAIVSGVANPSAMLVDTDGTGHSVRRGDYLGRPEVVQTGGEDAVPITLNWRVDRIRPGEVVLTREDPTAPNRPPLTRVIALHAEEAAPATL